MVNEKTREDMISETSWNCFIISSDAFDNFVNQFLNLKCSESEKEKNKSINLSSYEQISYILFLIKCYQSIEIPLIAKVKQKNNEIKHNTQYQIYMKNNAATT